MHHIHLGSQLNFITYDVIGPTKSSNHQVVVKPTVPIPCFTFHIELGNFEKLVFIQLSNLCNHLKPFYLTKKSSISLSQKSSSMPFGLIILSIEGFHHTHIINIYNLLIQPHFPFLQIQQIVAYWCLLLCCNPYHSYHHISKKNIQFDD